MQTQMGLRCKPVAALDPCLVPPHLWRIKAKTLNSNRYMMLMRLLVALRMEETLRCM